MAENKILIFVAKDPLYDNSLMLYGWELFQPQPIIVYGIDFSQPALLLDPKQDDLLRVDGVKNGFMVQTDKVIRNPPQEDIDSATPWSTFWEENKDWYR
jgi:hypothetical protein